MTKEELLNLLGSVDSENAGIAIAFVEGLADRDGRFAKSFSGPSTTVGYWAQQARASAGVISPCRVSFLPSSLEISPIGD